jgi:hypothetical protein
MNTNRIRLAATTALAAAAILNTGCGSGAKTPTTSVGSYTSAVTKLHATVENASSQFFHAPRARLSIEARTLQRAYAAAAQQLQALNPPNAGATQAHTLLAAWRGAASDLGNVLSVRPFDPGRAWNVAQQSGTQSDRSYGDVLAIP